MSYLLNLLWVVLAVVVKQLECKQTPHNSSIESDQSWAIELCSFRQVDSISVLEVLLASGTMPS
eukprot:9554-Heterococcus_DN1.PRE.3